MRRLDRLSVSRELEAALIERLGAELRPVQRSPRRPGMPMYVILLVIAAAALTIALLAFIHR
jgi:hypothetical protein